MWEILDVFCVGDMLSITLEGICDGIKNGTRLIDENGNVHEVVSVAMTDNEYPADIRNSTTLLIAGCSLKKGDMLKIV